MYIPKTCPCCERTHQNLSDTTKICSLCEANVGAEARRVAFQDVEKKFEECQDGGVNYTHFYEDFVVVFGSWLGEQSK